MVMLGCGSIRDVIAFPKVSSSAELMSDAPTDVDEQQLNELGISTLPKKPQA
jgi:aspartyl-tRNA synthetase